MKKGSSFERKFSKFLSLWWTRGEHDDRFYRSAGSGARATARKGRNQATFMQAGDIAATHPDANPLMQFLTFELKCGYNDSSVSDVFDTLPTAKTNKWLSFWEQAKTGAANNGSFGWMLVTQRTRRTPMVWVPAHVASALRMIGVPAPPIQFRLPDHSIGHGSPMEEWFEDVMPEDIAQFLALKNQNDRLPAG